MNERASRYSWYVLAVLLCVYSINWMDRYVLVILLEPIKQELRLSDSALGLLSGFAFALLYSFAGLPIARFADRTVRRSLISAGLVFWSAATALSGLAGSFAHLLCARLGVALGESTCSPAASSLIADYFPAHRRATAFAVYGVGISIGLGLGLSVGGWANERYGWRAALYIVAVPGLLLALLLQLTVREPARGAAEASAVDAAHYSTWQTVRALIQRRSFLAYTVGLGLFSFAGNAFETWTPTYLMRTYHQGTELVGAWTGFVESFAGLTGTLAGGLLADQLGRRDERWYLWVPAGAAALMLPFMLGFLHASGLPMFACFFVFTFFSSSYMAPLVAITQRLMPLRLRAQATAMLYLLLNLIGPGAGPTVTGILSDALTPSQGANGLRLALTATLAGAACGVALTLYGARRLPADLAQAERLSAPEGGVPAAAGSVSVP